jgi:hypothetical protein
MGRSKKKTPSTEVKITCHPVVRLYLKALVDKGLYGGSEAEVAGRFVENELKRLVETKAIDQIAWPREGDA